MLGKAWRDQLSTCHALLRGNSCLLNQVLHIWQIKYRNITCEGSQIFCWKTVEWFSQMCPGMVSCYRIISQTHPIYYINEIANNPCKPINMLFVEISRHTFFGFRKFAEWASMLNKMLSWIHLLCILHKIFLKIPNYEAYQNYNKSYAHLTLCSFYSRHSHITIFPILIKFLARWRPRRLITGGPHTSRQHAYSRTN